jgi:tetratricopeptide (TPR) repeat protein/transcriptional regulator with XRE-family HTH domain
VAEQPALSFAELLRQLRAEAALTQEGLAEAAGLSPRSVSDLERGINRTARLDTARLLADALGLAGPVRMAFVAAARGAALAAEVLAARHGEALGAFAAATTRGLPRDIASFTGRQAELSRLVEALAATAAGGGVVGIHAIDGMAGVGKTTFAVHAAHRLTGTFPDGQFFLPLHAHTAGQRPVDPADALASLLLTAGVPAAQIPPGLQARAGRWRDQVAGKKVLLLLDDAAGHEQVRPLLPGTAGSLVLVTSRRRLAALDDATVISLDTLPPGEAAALLVRLAARPGLRQGDTAVGQITRLCGYLPLAVGMVASQLRHHPAWSAADLAAELAAAKDRLALLHAENLSAGAAFDLSYRDLDPAQQRLFRRLGLVPGPSFDGYAAAALEDTSLGQARRNLEELYDHHLIDEPAPGRYRMHDLLREHARALADRLDLASGRDQAVARLLNYYQHTAARADALIARQTRPAPADGTKPAAVPALADQEQALAWARAERASLIGCLDYATHTGQHAWVTALTAGLAGLLRRDGPWAEAITRHTAAVQAARCLGDRLGQANALTDLGAARRLTDDYPAAAQALEQALDIYRDLGDRLGQANALRFLGAVRRLTGDYPAAAQTLEQALVIHRDLGDRFGQASALLYLGDVWLATGDYPAAAQTLEQALDIYRDIGNQNGQAEVLNKRGTLHRASGELTQAQGCHQQALELAHAIASSWDEAHALAGLGRCAMAAGHATQAAILMRQALRIFQRIGAAEAPDLLAELDALTGPPPAQ